MGKASRRARERHDGEKPTPEQLSSGEFDRRTVGHAEEDQSHSVAYVRRQSRSALEYMNQRGSLTDEQLDSARQIAEIAEMLERNAAVRSASMEARVDCSGSARDALIESLRMVRAEAAYSEWRCRLPLPRRMVIDMVIEDTGLKAIAKRHHMPWLDARPRLIAALDLWPDVHAKFCRLIGREELDRRHDALRGG